jgi:hypothetical protein
MSFVTIASWARAPEGLAAEGFGRLEPLFANHSSCQVPRETDSRGGVKVLAAELTLSPH